jgi:hypothetical protein
MSSSLQIVCWLLLSEQRTWLVEGAARRIQGNAITAAIAFMRQELEANSNDTSASPPRLMLKGYGACTWRLLEIRTMFKRGD